MSSNINAKSVVSVAVSMAATSMLVPSFARNIIPRELKPYLITKFQHFLSTFASMAATAMLVRSFTRDIIPHELITMFQHFLITKFQHFLSTFSNEVTLVINERNGLSRNQLFNAARLYIDTIAVPSAKTLHASLHGKEKKIHMSSGMNEEVIDTFCGYQLKWRLVTQHEKVDEYHNSITSTARFLNLTFHKRHKSKVVDEYLPYVVERSKHVREKKKTLKLHTLSDTRYRGLGIKSWQSMNLDHPANFQTLALDDDVKQMIIDDLDRFVKRKELYRKVGKAWKRGYLLYGPPGTGKSTLIAAMANYLNFDVYDLELTDLRQNSDLRRLLIETKNRSILVVEDIDATFDLSERKSATLDLSERKSAAKKPERMHPFHHDQDPKVTLSGLLNFIDGLWTSCGDERIIIFTTNHKERLDPALLRPGRMDVHIHMSYCTPCGFRLLAANYLGITEPHPLVAQAELLIASAKVTPAEVGEQLLKSDDPEIAIKGLIVYLERKQEVTDIRHEEAHVDMSGKIVTKGEDFEASYVQVSGKQDEN